jgi:hypothetical protein
MQANPYRATQQVGAILLALPRGVVGLAILAVIAQRYRFDVRRLLQPARTHGAER